MTAYVFPGQGSQFKGMGKDLYSIPEAKELFDKADRLIGFELSKIMFNGTEEDLKQTKITQPAIFLHSFITAELKLKGFKPHMVAGHSLGEISALAAAGALGFEDSFYLVIKRAEAMQKACETSSGSMAAILGLEDSKVEKICSETEGIVVPANYNCPGQLVISGDKESVSKACIALKNAGAKKALTLPVGGAFHSPLMESARKEFAQAIKNVNIKPPVCPIYQNITALAHTDPNIIKQNLIDQLTGSVKWTESVLNMTEAGANSFLEIGPGNTLQGLIKKTVPEASIKSALDT